MSNPYRNEQMETALKRRKLVAEAVRKLYLAREGGRIDAQLRLYDTGIALANFCREDELKRARESASSIRPWASVSEGRLYAGKQLALMDRRDELMAACREQIVSFLDSQSIESTEQLEAALEWGVEVLAEGLDSTSRASKPADEEAVVAEAKALIAEMPSAEDRAALAEVQRTGDEKTMQQILLRQPEDWLLRWVLMLNKSGD